MMRAFKFLALILVVYLPATRVQAQEVDPYHQSTGPTAPLSPLDTREKTTANDPVNTQVQDSAQIEPDNHLLSGAETLGLGSLRYLTNIFDPSLRVSESADTGASANKPDSVTSAGGSLDFAHSSSRQFLALMYSGGASLYRGPAVYNQQFHDLGLSEAVLLGKWTFRLGDSLTFASQGASFGGFNTGGLNFGSQANPLSGLQSGLVPTLQPGLLPLQTISTGIADRVGEVGFAEADYTVTRRTDITLEGSYGLIHFLSGGYVNGVQKQGRLGYNHLFGQKNRVAIFYDYTDSTFGGTNQSIESQSLQLSYGRTIVGRLAWQVGGGPGLRDLRNYPSLGGQRFTWTVHSGLTYATRSTDYRFSYFHGITLGSGVFLGANSDTFIASVNRPLTRFWTGYVNVGYARNSNLIVSKAFSNLFENWYANADLGRPIGRQLQFDMNYGFQQQNLGGGLCPVLSCGITSHRHVLTINFSWHPLTSGSERGTYPGRRG